MAHGLTPPFSVLESMNQSSPRKYKQTHASLIAYEKSTCNFMRFQMLRQYRITTTNMAASRLHAEPARVCLLVSDHCPAEVITRLDSALP